MTRRTDMTGAKIWWLTVLVPAGKTPKGVATWRCRCECGVEVVRRGDYLRNDRARHCGCKTGELASCGRGQGRACEARRCPGKSTNPDATAAGRRRHGGRAGPSHRGKARGWADRSARRRHQGGIPTCGVALDAVAQI